jgi:hypothetical protein
MRKRKEPHAPQRQRVHESAKGTMSSCLGTSCTHSLSAAPAPTANHSHAPNGRTVPCARHATRTCAAISVIRRRRHSAPYIPLRPVAMVRARQHAAAEHAAVVQLHTFLELGYTSILAHLDAPPRDDEVAHLAPEKLAVFSDAALLNMYADLAHVRGLCPGAARTRQVLPELCASGQVTRSRTSSTIAGRRPRK